MRALVFRGNTVLNPFDIDTASKRRIGNGNFKERWQFGFSACLHGDKYILDKLPRADGRGWKGL